jgi:excisionase family DNA binding protein
VEEMLKIAEVGRELGLSEPTVRRYLKTGKIPSVFIGGRYRVRRSDLEEFVRRSEVKPAGAGGTQPPLEEPRPDEAFRVVGRIVEGKGGTNERRWVVKWAVPEDERDRYRDDVRMLTGGDDYDEETLTTEQAAVLMAATG